MSEYRVWGGWNPGPLLLYLTVGTWKPHSTDEETHQAQLADLLYKSDALKENRNPSLNGTHNHTY